MSPTVIPDATNSFYVAIDAGVLSPLPGMIAEVPFTGSDSNSYHLLFAQPTNVATCATQMGMMNNEQIPFATATKQHRDGALDSGHPSGTIAGTPTGIINKSDIEQTARGVALQLNWNLDRHKLMVGTSIDHSAAAYVAKQRLALLDNNRNVYSDPSQLGTEFFFADHDATINDFDGTSVTKSLYFSETWSPAQTLNLSLSGRYNHTRVKNNLAPAIAEYDLEGPRYWNSYAFGVICPGNDLTKCPYNLGPVPADVWHALYEKYYGAAVKGAGGNLLDKAETEKFSYRSLNPAIGVTWQAKPNLNLYANWNQGTRAPSVIELGCAYDDTLVDNGWGGKTPRSLLQGRGCTLPTSMSGDPYLPQVKAQTMEIGARGKFKDFLEWNVTAYRTDVKDDIYMVSPTQTLSFFQDVGDTRRQGIEFGLAGEYGKSDFRMNYSLTEATFQSTFFMASPNNSSRHLLDGQGQDNLIMVHPGNVMPGVPFNNMNFNWGYKLTRDLKLNFSVVAHSRSYLRGNENNGHTPGLGRVSVYENGPTTTVTTMPPSNYSGTAPGYAVLNFNSRYDIGKGWAASLLVNNVLDKKYYTAGRLGENPFAPSTLGAIGPGGFNYNSNEWTPSQFISAGAPRGFWVSLSYDFDASKKNEPPPSTLSMNEPDRLIPPPASTPTAEEIALVRTLDRVKALPVLNRKQVDAATRTAEHEVKAAVEVWRKALAASDVDSYLKTYAPTYAPAGESHDQWAEKQKLRLVTEAAANVENGEVVVAPQGSRMVAVFKHKFAINQRQEAVRKVLTLEQKDGQWLIVREHALPTSVNSVAKPTVKPKASLMEPPATKPEKSGSIKVTRADGPVGTESR